MFLNLFLGVERSHNLAFHLLASVKYCHPEQLLLFVFLLINLRLNMILIPRVRAGKISHGDPSEACLEIHRLLQVAQVPTKWSFARWLMSGADV